ncbi:aminotransferase class III-fold pyridoxal phosphate-dependent enzyme [Streptomyces sp. AgN23]|uniref:aminotransferase class III-fold pyridoxal phosphate-dependent enzyme n=1 Tax=Streptomyces sp. AgN23 TaxID=1188315 RepID=UPI001B32482F|nr:aminotransferase class III-fold pyridoxal phosphate-dependent enzyme [Streptomyces sp. AgN23]QTI90416.1 aminotransferase class III-fold pyridoxal phosphate-dependent enzyme [Streptomyces sp. AgN23]
MGLGRSGGGARIAVGDRGGQHGRFLFDGQRGLATRYSLIGEVRGTGLILGFELIAPKTKVPAVAATNAVLAQCRERGLLIGKGGLLGNVLRVTPPMTVTLDEARQALGMLDDVLARITPQAEPQADS